MNIQHILMKHMGSTAADLPIQFAIDEANQVVEVETHAFDSGLFEHFLVGELERQYGVVAIRDDRNAWHPPRPPYRVFLALHGQRYEVTAHRLPLGGITVVLKPV